MKKNEYRCLGCNEIKKDTNMVWVAWFRTKETRSHNSQFAAMCRKCASSQRKGETGRKLSERIQLEQIFKNVRGF
jgi:hypothetical protein